MATGWNGRAKISAKWANAVGRAKNSAPGFSPCLKKTARHCWRAVSVSQPTKESFLAAGLSLAQPGNVLLNLSISLLLKRGQRLLLLRR